MAWTARDALRYVYPILTQYWATHALGNETFLSMINMAMLDIWTHRWHRRTRQHWKDNFTSLEDTPYRLITTWPIRDIDRFYTWEMIKRDWFKENILCTDCDIPQWYCAPCSPCWCNGCKPLDLYEVLPQNELCPWEYAITWSDFEWMWWFAWQIIRVFPKSPVDSLRVTYYREFKPVETFDDKMPIPLSFASVLAKLMAFYVLWRYWQFRIWEENNMFQFARQQLDELYEADQQNPKKMDLWNLHELYNNSYQ